MRSLSSSTKGKSNGPRQKCDLYTYRYQHKVDRKCRGEEGGGGLNSRERTQRKKLDQFGQFGFFQSGKEREEWKSLRKKRAI